MQKQTFERIDRMETRIARMEKWIIGGLFPKCVYVIGDHEPRRNPWYSRFYAWIVNTVLKIFKR